ncbi:MAG: hypothetical protein WC456_01615 [Patescibacteria group bacterium]
MAKIAKDFVEHVVFDKAQDLLFSIFTNIGKEVADKGVQYLKSLPFGVGFNDEENYIHAEIYARQYLNVTDSDIENLTAYLKELTPAQLTEFRLLVARRCEFIKAKGASGNEEQVLVNPDGAAIIKYFAQLKTREDFIAALKRSGADRNLPDNLRKAFSAGAEKVINNPLIKEKTAQTKGWLNSLNSTFADLADKLEQSGGRS